MPNLGVLSAGAGATQAVLADLPGLIEGECAVRAWVKHRQHLLYTPLLPSQLICRRYPASVNPHPPVRAPQHMRGCTSLHPLSLHFCC